MSLLGHLPAIVRASESQTAAEMVPWQQFLADAGKKLDAQFTIEFATLPFANGAKQISANLTFSSIDELVAILSTNLDWLSFRINETHPRVIHVIDKRLEGRKGYALEKKIDVEFAGVLADLPWVLHRRVDNLYGFRVGGIHDIATDYYTETVVRATNKTARQILTDAVPLRCYGPILWRAMMQTDASDPGGAIDVRFYENKDERVGRVRWWWWLEAAGKPFGCHFTIETVYRGPDDEASCPVFFAANERFDSVDELIEELTKRVPTLAAVKHPGQPTIIHFIDKALLKRPDYVLDRSMDIDYEGTPDGLAQWLRGRQPRVGPKLLAENQTPAHGDPKTHVVVHEKGKVLRRILTDCIPTERERDVLWHARTWLRNDGPHTTVEYIFPQ